MRVFILTGEPSGDLHGAYLARALRALDPSITLSGVGGALMAQAAVSLVARSEHWGAIGVVAALGKVPRLFRQMRRLTRLLRDDPPDALVLIDFGGFNVRLLQRLRGSGVRSVYYIPPGCWSRHRAAGNLPFLVDAIATPFSWSAENLRRARSGATIEWVGHPILDYTLTAPSRARAREQLGIPDDQPMLAILPGSRRAEVRHLLAVLLASIRYLSPRPRIILSVAPSISESTLRRLAPSDLEIDYVQGLDYTHIAAADAALVASGTATLELACLRVPMVVAYRASWASAVQYLIIKQLASLRHISLPNILTETDIVPELLGAAANPKNLASALAPLLHDTPARQAQLAAFEEIRALLGDGTAVQRTAKLVLAIAARADDAQLR
jgi:lipid-A-disaccharide synthase